MKLIVPDASVVLKWVLSGADEPDLDAALRLRDMAIEGKIAIKVPSLWLFEAANLLARKFPLKARVLLDTLIDFGFDEGKPAFEWRDRAFDLCQRYQVTFYDAAYHALAIIEKGLFVTADGRYAQKAGKAGSVVELVHWK